MYWWKRIHKAAAEDESCRTACLNETCSRRAGTSGDPGPPWGSNWRWKKVHQYMHTILSLLYTDTMWMSTCRQKCVGLFVSWGKEALIFREGWTQAHAVLSLVSFLPASSRKQQPFTTLSWNQAWFAPVCLFQNTHRMKAKNGGVDGREREGSMRPPADISDFAQTWEKVSLAAALFYSLGCDQISCARHGDGNQRLAHHY